MQADSHQLHQDKSFHHLASYRSLSGTTGGVVFPGIPQRTGKDSVSISAALADRDCPLP